MLSLGCPKTLVDSELILGKLDPERFDIAATVAECDVALVNTCAFIKSSQEESVDHILRLIELKKTGDIQKLVVMGCLVQRFPKELQRELGEVDAFVGSGEYASIPEILENVTAGSAAFRIGIPGYLYTSAEKRIALTPGHSRYLKISEGCDHVCSFCVIPQFRGVHRSRSLKDVVEEAKLLIHEGAQELVLTGQDTTYFGYDLEGRYLLPELLSALNDLPGVRWIRILYAYPSLVSEKLIESMASLQKVCHYLDMPLQHINDRILKSMRRGTTHASTERVLGRLRERIPDLAIRTTFIVGYPGETEAEFQELLNFMEKMRFERLGVFVYSQEEGSPAAAIPEQIPQTVKEKRLQEAMLLQQKISRQNNERLLGKVLEVLVEGYQEETKMWTGRTYMDAPEVDGSVFIRRGLTRERLVPGQFVRVRVKDTLEYDLIGEKIESPA